MPGVRDQPEDRYKWVNRFAAEGEGGLEKRSRAAQSCPHRTEERCEQALVAPRKKHPHWGSEKLRRLLGDREPDWPWPASSTAGDILKRHGLVEPRRRRHGSPPVPAPTVAVAAPNAR
ncbi:MAG: helix-turn-helix domain-containing protein [Thermoanaerobaculia bacterium]|nr:helix-turn-helix domain-containing protein [Thermoanaerobaculia bacterium]